MPAFVKTNKDEKVWSKAKNKAREQYPELSEKDDRFWKLTTSIYKNMNGNKTMRKTASNIATIALQKLAYVPLTQAAQDAMAQQGGGGMPQDPSMMGGDPSMMGGDPSMMGGQMPPQDPSMMGGQQGGMPQMPIQTVPGPNGEPIDPETGFIVIDPEQGIEQEPTTGILFSKFTGEFMTPDGQPMDPEQAQMMIEEAMMSQQGGGQMPPQDPSMMGGDPSMGGQMPQDPSMMGGDPSMMGGQMPPQDPSMMGGDPSMMGGQMPPQDPATGQPLIDDQTGLPIDPQTGYFTNNAMAPQGAEQGGTETIEQIMPEIESFINRMEVNNDRQEKFNKKIMNDISGFRLDIQGLRREEEKKNDNIDTALARMENMLDIIENAVIGNNMPPMN